MHSLRLFGAWLACALAGWLSCGLTFDATAAAYVRVNQAGYTTAESKKAILLSSATETGTFSVVDTATGSNVLTGSIFTSGLGWSGTLTKTYTLDFSSVTNPGIYTIQVAASVNATSPPIVISNAVAIYRPLLTNALFYFQSSRDGPNVITNVISRRPSHLADQVAFTYLPPVYNASGNLTGGLTNIGGPIDVSGGWFDAGDYVKLVETASYVEGMMLFTVRQYPRLTRNIDFFGESAYGLDWLLKMWDQDNQILYYFVGLGDGNGSTILADHDIWRLPEADDQLNVAPGNPEYYIKYRPVFRAGTNGTPVSPNLAGRLAASFALGSQVFRTSNVALADRCLVAAQTIFDLAQTNNITQLLTAAPYDYYPETEWRDDLEWGAAELYFATVQTNRVPGLLHTNALFYLTNSAHWAAQYMRSPNHLTDSLNLYDTSALAHFELARAMTQSGVGVGSGLETNRQAVFNDIGAQLAAGQSQGNNDPFGLGIAYSPSGDPVPHALGYAITANLYRQLVGPTAYDGFGLIQRDWALGRNAWGTSFTVGAGSTFPHCMQDQIANLAGSLDGTPPLRLGATVDGPNNDLSGAGGVTGMNVCGGANGFAAFDGMGAHYIDNVEYWMTVEPALDYTVPTALLWVQQMGDPAVPRLQSPAYLNNQDFVFNLSGTAGYGYVIQSSSNLINWTSLQTNVAPFSFTNAVTGPSTRQFYRALLAP